MLPPAVKNRSRGRHGFLPIFRGCACADRRLPRRPSLTASPLAFGPSPPLLPKSMFAFARTGLFPVSNGGTDYDHCHR